MAPFQQGRRALRTHGSPDPRTGPPQWRTRLGPDSNRLLGRDGTTAPERNRHWPRSVLEPPGMAEPPPIVIGTDLSEASDEATKQASDWARRVGAPLVAVHIASESIFKKLERSKVIDALSARLVPLAGADLEVTVESASPHVGLIQFAKEREAQLLVVGASGAGLRRTLFGSTAEHVMRYSECPTLVARPSPADGPVLAATDFSDGALPALRHASTEAARRGVELVLLHSVYDPPTPLAALGPMVFSVPQPTEEDLAAVRDAAEETLRTWLRSEGVEGSTAVTVGPPADRIVAEANARGASLVVVGTHGRTGFGRMALGSVAEAVTRHAPCSVLAVRL